MKNILYIQSSIIIKNIHATLLWNLLFSIWHCVIFEHYNDPKMQFHRKFMHSNFILTLMVKKTNNIFSDFEYFVIFLVASCMCVCSWPFLGPVVIHSNIHYCPYHRKVWHVAASFLGCKIKKIFHDPTKFNYLF